MSLFLLSEYTGYIGNIYDLEEHYMRMWLPDQPAQHYCLILHAVQFSISHL